MNQTALTDKKLRYLGGFTILFWGYQCELIWFAIPMTIIFEARFLFNRRWALTKKDFNQIADLTSVGLLVMVFFLFINRTEYHFITTLIAWLPILFFPLTTVIGYSTTSRMPLDVLFYSLRRQKEPVNQSWDLDYILLGGCLLAAGLNREGSYYFPIAATILTLVLFSLRSPRFNTRVFVLTMSIVVLSATLFHHAQRDAHHALKAKTAAWIQTWIDRRTDPFKTRTALGQVGKLKLSDAIAFRIEPSSGEPDFPPLLREAAYNAATATDWEVFDRRLAEHKEVDDYLWAFTPGPQDLYPEAKIYLEFDRDQSPIPVPAELTEINQLAANTLKKSRYGTIQGLGLIPAPFYRVRYQTRGHLGNDPKASDLIIPATYADYLATIAPKGLDDEASLNFVQEYFHEFRYTLYQPDIEISENPLIHFMDEKKAGHCEYFASATALLLRQLGIPSRYVVGYAVKEWNDDLSMYIIRKRHAHAWAIAWVNNRWIAVDTTPSTWLAMEESNASFLQPFWDYLGNNQFLFLRWWNDQELEDYERELFFLGFILMAVLAWRIFRSEQIILSEESAVDVKTWILPGRESPFFRIEDQLSEMGYRRGRGELMVNWLLRIERPELLPLLTSHNRWRFDPQGISMEERKTLAEQVHEWLHLNPEADSARLMP